MSGPSSVLMLVFVGAMIAVQATVNGVFGRGVGLVLFAVAFSVAQTVCALPGLALWGWPVRWTHLSQTPWWHFLGALLGVFILIGIAYGISRTGTFVAMCSLLVGQMTMGLIIDQFGLFGASTQPLTLGKIIGLGFLAAGVFLVKH